MDIRNLKPTDLKSNKRVVLPEPDDDLIEIKRGNLKNELRQVVINYKKEYCDKFGNLLDNNLSETQQREIRNLKSRIKEEGLTCGETDKTGKMTLDTLENLSKKMDKHIGEDKVLNENEVKRLENKLNRHMTFWVGILKPGENVKQMRRVKSNLITKDGQIPVLRGTSKDHKEAKDKVRGPDVRPIMGAIVGPNIGLSEIGSIIVRKIADNADVGLVARSTEEVLNKFEKYNKERFEKSLGLKKLIIASMDIEKFYPSILSQKSARIIRKMWEESELSIEGVDINKLSEYLGKHLKKEEIIEEEFEEIVYTRKLKEKRKKRTVTKKIGRKYTNEKTKSKVKDNNVDMDTENENKKDNVDISNSEGSDTLTTNENNKKKRKKKAQVWNKPQRSPTRIEERRMFGKALEVMLITCMDNHIYLFENKVRIQKHGGPIGLKLTGEIAV